MKIPLEYWREGWHEKLSMPAKAVLLIALSLDDGFLLPIEKAKDWYALSRDTVQRGLAELQDHQLLAKTVEFKPTPLTPLGYTEQRRYTLQPPFGPLRAKKD